MPEQNYTRLQVRRMLGISERQLRSWEKLHLIPAQDSFAFPDLIALRTLARLRANHIPPARIRRAVAALRKKLRGIRNPLNELKIFSDGKKLTVQMAGNRMDPISGQLLLNFDSAEMNKLFSFPQKAQSDDRSRAAQQYEATLYFDKALELEQKGAPAKEIIRAYEEVIERDPKSVAALTNLGTVYYHLRKLDEAERYYRKALEVDPGYALAHFNLGNLFDEKCDRSQALFHYLMAVRLNPNYSDAHYNLALLYQSSGQALRAVRHWKIYLKLDPVSPWATIARQELEKLCEATIVHSKPTAT
jgi:tetratricopeptide (TPR) repeat protein